MRIKAAECAGLVVDLQERLFPVVHQCDHLLERVVILLKGLKAMDLPILVTEQYPKGLGTTLPQVAELLEPQGTIEKLSFSCCGEPLFLSALGQLDRKRVIICGIEAHADRNRSHGRGDHPGGGGRLYLLPEPGR
jgi:nicotinamidase-related amidase